jgi:hypothetical protein
MKEDSNMKKQLRYFVMTLALLTTSTAAWADKIDVIVQNPEAGTAVVDKPNATAGETVTLTVTPVMGYRIQKENIKVEKYIDPGTAQGRTRQESPGWAEMLELTGADPVMSNAGVYTFTMPEDCDGVRITLFFDSYDWYTINQAENGTVSISVEDGVVTLIPTPTAGYFLKSLTITYTDDDGNVHNVEWEDGANGTKTFDLPSYPVTITAVFAEKTPAVITAAPTAKELTYTGDAQKLVRVGKVDGGTMEYSLDGETFSKDNPTATEVGTYTVYYRAAGDENHTDAEGGSLTVTIAKATPVITKEPKANALSYSAKAQELITAGEAEGGTLEYSLDGTNYGPNIPMGTDAMIYTVFYRLKGDANHTDIAAVELKVMIAKDTDPIFTAPTAKTLTYNGEAQGLVDAGTAEGGEVLYSLDGENYSATVPTGLMPQDYTVWYRVAGDQNHSDIAPATVTVTIGKALLTIKADNKMIYEGETLPELTYTCSGLFGNDKLTSLPVLSTDATATSEFGVYTISINGGAADNYVVKNENGKLSISPRLKTDEGKDVAGYITENDEGEISVIITELPAETFSDTEEIPTTDEGRLDIPIVVSGSNGDTYQVTQVSSEVFEDLPTDAIVILPEGVSTDEPVTNVVNGDGTCQEMDLSDIEKLNLPIPVTVENVIYQREVKEKRLTICLPWSIPIPEGARAYTLKDENGNTALFEVIDQDELEAYMPYVLVFNEGIEARRKHTRAPETSGFTIDLSGTNAVIDPLHAEEAIAKGDLKMFGTITGLTHAEGIAKQAYIMQEDYSWQITASSDPADANKIYLAPFQAYLCSVSPVPVENIESDFNGLYGLEGISFTESKHWATYYSSENLKIPEGLTAYVVDSFDENEVNVTAIDYVPAQVGVLLFSETAGANYSTTVYNGSDKGYTSLLKGSLIAQTLEDEEGYILYKDEFVLTSGGTISANRCYLPVTDVKANASRLKIKTNNSPTDIFGIKVPQAAVDENWYMLDGRRLNQRPVRKGLYIRNGQKVFLK